MENKPSSQRGFWFLIATQFQGAFSDNAYKYVLTLAAGTAYVSIIAGVFTLPFLLFTMYGGFLADRFSKRSVTIGIRILEVVIMVFAAAALWFGHLYLSIGLLFMLGGQAALFSATKYGILPELLPDKKLSWGNGVLELTTFMAIILGTVAGGMLFDRLDARLYVAGLVLVALAVVGTLTSLGVSRVPPANPSVPFRVNFIPATFKALSRARSDSVLWLAILGNTYFWFIGLLLQLNIIVFGQLDLHLGGTEIGIMQAILAIGIGLGSYLAGRLSHGKIEYGLVPLGSLGMTIFLFGLSIQGWGFSGGAGMVAGLGFFAGFFAVPVNALIQHRPPREVRGMAVGAANLLTSLGMVSAALVHWLLTWLQWTPSQIFLFSAVLTVAVTVYLLILLPDALLRFVLWILVHTLYRIHVVGRDNIPERGGALFVSNHLSLIDALLLLASTDRRVRFLMYKGIYDRPFVRPFARIMQAIPVSSHEGPRVVIEALREASRQIRQGRVVCIFAEGQMTRTGQLLPFRRGFERIMKDVDAPIIPIFLDGVWGSIFSFDRGRYFWKLPRRLLQRVTVSFGAALPPDSPAPVVRQAVQELAVEAFRLRKADQQLLPVAFVRAARRHPLRFAAADGMTPRVRYFALLVRTIVLARMLKPHWAGQKMVGLLLPPSVAGAAANLAVSLAGKVPVNLNYTVSQPILDSCVRQCGIQTLITSRRFLEKVAVKVPESAILLEDLVARKSAGSVALAVVLALLVPSRRLERWLGADETRNVDSLATVIFSSGSTGDPKGVMLSHYNIQSNLEGLAQVCAVSPHDRIMGILPFFHSFGFTATLWFPLLNGMGAVYHPNPFDSRIIGELVLRYRATMLLATPTMLQSFIRRCEPELFGSLQYVIAGAEKLTQQVADAFEEKFGMRPLEGYGSTECSPIVTINVRDFRGAGFYQVGAKRGRIGHPLPGISVRIVDPETMVPRGVGEPGLLLVRGPNVMIGYLHQPEKTAEVLRDGWYVTGDIAAIDEDGFLTITDRLSRFAKIGGEMVPLVRVEERLHELAGSSDRVLAVAAVPDEDRGEKLVVLHTLSEEHLLRLLERLSESGLPNLWVPRPKAFFRVDQIPVLGTGKLDLAAIRKEAIEQASSMSGPHSAT